MRTKKFKSSLIYIFVFLFSLIFIFNSSMSLAFAESIEYTNVLTDLQKDESFDIESFPELENDYSLQVIQIAESVNQELFIYVYQPSGETKNLVATEIRFSIDNETWKDYGLELLSSYDTLFKYKVKDFVVLNEDVRTYNLTAIFRKWDETIDEPATGDNTIDYVSFKVGQLWTAKSTDDGVYYNFIESKTVDITDKFVGFLRYQTAWWLTGTSCDSHFVAFSTDYDIDNLFEVDMSFITRTYKQTYDTGALGGVELPADPYTFEYGDPILNEKTLNYDDVEEINTGLIFATKKYSWNRIESVETFLQNENLTSTAKKEVENKQFVLRFYESDFREWADSVGAVMIKEYETGVRVREVSLLRLKFETNGITYNLGVVDNKQTGSNVPSNEQKSWWDINGWWVILILAIIVAIPFLPFILWLLKIVLKAIWWLITLPFEIFK